MLSPLAIVMCLKISVAEMQFHVRFQVLMVESCVKRDLSSGFSKSQIPHQRFGVQGVLYPVAALRVMTCVQSSSIGETIEPMTSIALDGKFWVSL
jgi:hypothetical protein